MDVAGPCRQPAQFLPPRSDDPIAPRDSSMRPGGSPALSPPCPPAGHFSIPGGATLSPPPGKKVRCAIPARQARGAPDGTRGRVRSSQMPAAAESAAPPDAIQGEQVQFREVRREPLPAVGLSGRFRMWMRESLHYGGGLLFPEVAKLPQGVVDDDRLL